MFTKNYSDPETKPSPRVLTTAEAVEAMRANRLAMLDELKDLEALKYGWDNHKGRPARPDVVAEIRHRLLGAYGMDLRNLPAPKMLLFPRDGSISIVFSLGTRTVTIQVVCSSVIHYACSSDAGYMIDGTIRLYEGSPATGLCVEIDEVTEWLLDHKEDWDGEPKSARKR